MADGAREGLPSSNRGVNGSGSDELARARASKLRTWAGLDWVAGSLDLLELLAEQGWDVDGADGDALTALLCAHGPKKPAKGEKGTAAIERARKAHGLRCRPPTPEGFDVDPDTGEILTGRKARYVEPGEVERQIVQAAFQYLFSDTGLQLAADAGPGKFYAYRWMLTNVHGKPAGMLELGGELTLRKDGRPSLRYELTGLGCAMYEARGDASADHAQRWCALRAKLERVSAVPTRFDIAFDDFDGKRNLALCKAMYEVGEFDYKFGGEMKRPQSRALEASHGKGSTFYIGNSTSEKQLRCYEKGRQLGDTESPWVRWELQLKSSSRRKLTLDVMTNPLDYMRGAFECLDFISRTVERLAVTREATKATFKSVIRHAKRTYGSTVWALRMVCPDRESFLETVEALLEKEKPPKWAKTAALSWEDLQALVESRRMENSDEQ